MAKRGIYKEMKLNINVSKLVYIYKKLILRWCLEKLIFRVKVSFSFFNNSIYLIKR